VLITFLTVAAFVGYGLVMQRLQESSSIEYNTAEDIEKAGIADMLANIDSIKYFGKENFAKSKFKELSEETKEKTLRFWDYFRWLDAVHSLILTTGTFFLVYFTVTGFIRGEYTIGTMVFIYAVFANLIGYLFSFVHGIRNFYRSMADFEVLFRYSKIKNKVIDGKDAKDLEIREGEIRFKNVSFRYGKRQIFHNFNLVIPKNKKTAFVGHSGCGKTTLIKLLFRLYDINSGAILIDKKNIKNFKQESLRSEMSIVPQECILFDDTIYNNIAFSKPGVGRDEVYKAMKFAQLDKIIKDFPHKEHTIVGERGVKLSGGEKQRVSIARAILADKKILVLDEATSSLDSQTEHEIKKDLEGLMKGRTSIIIAHRLSTIMKADKVVVMQKGKIMQQGTHKNLIKRPGKYRQLWSLQKGGYIK
ncbi:MAG: ABC transporter ATP-binding protein, partial [Nanoarchaeota archaeon]|nr:ABC transporter ATP-binding protein [Nanoarchaeota archaeon]